MAKKKVWQKVLCNGAQVSEKVPLYNAIFIDLMDSLRFVHVHFGREYRNLLTRRMLL